MSFPVIVPKPQYDSQNDATFREEVRKRLGLAYDKRGDLIVPIGKRLAFTSPQGQVITFGYNNDGEFTIQQDANSPFGIASISYVSSVESSLEGQIAVLEIDVEAANDAAAAAASSALAAQTSETNAGSSATAAQTSATNASTSASNAATSATNASNSASNASTSASQASTSASNAAGSASAAAISATAAAASEFAADASATAASGSASAAASSATQAATSESNAAGSASNASSSATNAANSATSAGNSATAASTSASNAATSATNAGASEAAAGTSATNAATSATNAANSATAASGSASNAATSATNAGNSATAANTSATNASTSASNAATSETAAANSASAANTSASNASTSASQASTSASNAAGSASAAATSATNAASSETNAGNSASAASTSASNASTSATNAGNSASSASTSATNAANSATAASGSASAASTSASNASTSATNAGNSASAANTSATNAAASATNAAGSASTATTQASNASASASSASSSATLSANYAKQGGVAYTVSDFVADGLFWTTAFGGSPTTVADPSAQVTYTAVSGVGRVARVDLTSGNIYLQPKAVIQPQVNRKYRVRCRAKVHANASGGGTLAFGFYINGLDSAYGHTDPSADFSSAADGTLPSSDASFVEADGVVTFGLIYTCTAVSANSAYWRPRIDLTRSGGSGGVIEVREFLIEEVTDIETLSASVTTNASAITTVDGKLTASYGLTVDANGRIASMKLLSNGTTSSVKFKADTFSVYNGSTDEAPFVVEDGVVKAKKVQAATLSAISADIGTVTAGVVRNSGSTSAYNATLGVMVSLSGGYMLVQGAGFGSSSDLILWWGSTPSGASVTDPKLSTLTKTNGKWAMATDGKVYYGSAELSVVTGFGATVSNYNPYGGRIGAGDATTGSVTITVTGGSGTYVYQWAYVSGNNTLTCDSPTSGTTTWTGTLSSAGQQKTAYWVCTITDTSNGKTTTVGCEPLIAEES